MSKATKKSILFALGVLVLIAFAMWLRYASRHIFHSPAVSHLRSGLYVFLFSVWCYSLWIRIVQTQVRRYLVAISVLMVLWMLLRSIKFSIENTDAERWLWYFYYFPMLFIASVSSSRMISGICTSSRRSRSFASASFAFSAFSWFCFRISSVTSAAVICV